MIEELQLVNIEGLAMTGKVEKVEIIDCKRKGFARLRVKTRDGRILETKCLEGEAAKRNYAVIRLYIKWGPHIIDNQI